MARRISNFAVTFFQSVEFFYHNHRDDDIIVLEFEDTLRIVNQHIGVQDIDFSHDKSSSGD